MAGLPCVGGKRSFGVFALAERAVADLAQQARALVQASDMAPVDLVGVGVEMVRAEGCQAFEHRVDLAFGGEEAFGGQPALD